MNAFKAAVEMRRMEDGFKIFTTRKPFFEGLSPRDPNGPVLLDCLARLLDLDRGHLSLVQILLSRFSKDRRILQRNREDSARVDMTEGIVALYTGDLLTAIDLFDLVRRNARRLNHAELFGAASYYLPR